MSRLDRTRDFLQSNSYEMIMASVLCNSDAWEFGIRVRESLCGCDMIPAICVCLSHVPAALDVHVDDEL